jgi:hypothetical protein
METQSELEHQEVPKEEAAVKTFGAQKERYRDLHLAVRCHRQLQKRNQDDGGYSNKLAAAHRGITRHAEWHGTRVAAIQDGRSKRDDRKIRPRTVLQEELQKDRRSGRHIGRNRNATTA